jgi:hypothetical protein
MTITDYNHPSSSSASETVQPPSQTTTTIIVPDTTILVPAELRIHPVTRPGCGYGYGYGSFPPVPVPAHESVPPISRSVFKGNDSAILDFVRFADSGPSARLGRKRTQRQAGADGEEGVADAHRGDDQARSNEREGEEEDLTWLPHQQPDSPRRRSNRNVSFGSGIRAQSAPSSSSSPLPSPIPFPLPKTITRDEKDDASPVKLSESHHVRKREDGDRDDPGGDVTVDADERAAHGAGAIDEGPLSRSPAVTVAEEIQGPGLPFDYVWHAFDSGFHTGYAWEDERMTRGNPDCMCARFLPAYFFLDHWFCFVLFYYLSYIAFHVLSQLTLSFDSSFAFRFSVLMRAY